VVSDISEQPHAQFLQLRKKDANASDKHGICVTAERFESLNNARRLPVVTHVIMCVIKQKKIIATKTLSHRLKAHALFDFICSARAAET
jgi:hypothetical protein